MNTFGLSLPMSNHCQVKHVCTKFIILVFHLQPTRFAAGRLFVFLFNVYCCPCCDHLAGEKRARHFAFRCVP